MRPPGHCGWSSILNRSRKVGAWQRCALCRMRNVTAYLHYVNGSPMQGLFSLSEVGKIKGARAGSVGRESARPSCRLVYAAWVLGAKPRSSTSRTIAQILASRCSTCCIPCRESSTRCRIRLPPAASGPARDVLLSGRPDVSGDHRVQHAGRRGSQHPVDQRPPARLALLAEERRFSACSSCIRIVQNVSERVAHISASSLEQARTMGDISQAVRGKDRMRQEGAAAA